MYSKRKDILFKSAAKCFSINGYNKTSVNDIVKNANVAKGLFFYYFKNKLNCYKTILNEVLNYIDKCNDIEFESNKLCDRVLQVKINKFKLYKKCPYFFDFIGKAKLENSKMIKKIINEKMQEYEKFNFKTFFNKDEELISDLDIALLKIYLHISNGVFQSYNLNEFEFRKKECECKQYFQLIDNALYNV